MLPKGKLPAGIATIGFSAALAVDDATGPTGSSAAATTFGAALVEAAAVPLALAPLSDELHAPTPARSTQGHHTLTLRLSQSPRPPASGSRAAPIRRANVAFHVTLADFPPLFLQVFAGLFGLLWGSFLNVVIYRVPRGMSVSRPPSHCPACGKPVRPWLNVPVLSYLVLRGKAGCCGAKMSPRYPIVELIGGVLSLAVLQLTVLPLPHPTTSIGYALAVYASGLTFALALVATVFIDLEHMVVLPDKANGALALLGLGTASLRGLAWTDSLLGAAVGVGCGLAINGLYKLLRGRSGFASGDSVLLGVVGAWFGWPGALFALLGGAVQGTVLLILFRLFGGKVEEPAAAREEREAILREIEALPEAEREAATKEWREEDELADGPGEGLQAALAFGPFIGLAGLELLLFGDTLRDAFFLWVQA